MLCVVYNMTCRLFDNMFSMAFTIKILFYRTEIMMIIIIVTIILDDG